MGANPFIPSERYVWGRMINGNYGSGLVPNFTWEANDGLNNYKKEILQTDSNSLISDHPVALNKKPGVIRIFITGGSAALGCIQNRDVDPDGTYPANIYTYNSSIAGILKSKLQKSFPGRAFEVVNCAVMGHSFQQNYAQYMVSLHVFKPDILINIDGYNDTYYLMVGESKATIYVQNDVNQFLELEAKARNNIFPLSVRLANLLLDKYTNRMTQMPSSASSRTYIEPSYADYKMVKDSFANNAKGFLWLVSSFENQLHADSIYSIFCLQPILSRRMNQKELSSLEKKFLLNSEKMSFEQMAASNLPKNTVLKDKIPVIRNLAYAYLYDDYLSPEIDRIVTKAGGTYIDFNMAIKDLKPKDEFYVDYCHLTPLGTEFIAERLSEEVKKHLDDSHSH